MVVSTLAIAALFNPLRVASSTFIDRRFYRRKYDAARILAAYGTRLREEVDLENLAGELVAVVRADNTASPCFTVASFDREERARMQKYR